MSAYALVIVVQADSAEQAWDAVADLESVLGADYIGQAHEIPTADEYAADPLRGTRIDERTVVIL